MTPKEEKALYRKKRRIYFLFVVGIEFICYTLFYLAFSLFNSIIELHPYIRAICLLLFFPITYYLTIRIANTKWLDEFVNKL